MTMTTEHAKLAQKLSKLQNGCLVIIVSCCPRRDTNENLSSWLRRSPNSSADGASMAQAISPSSPRSRVRSLSNYVELHGPLMTPPTSLQARGGQGRCSGMSWMFDVWSRYLTPSLSKHGVFQSLHHQSWMLFTNLAQSGSHKSMNLAHSNLVGH